MQLRYCFLSILSFLSFAVFSQNARKVADTALYAPTALIELFSSEGCNSCPLADDFMQEIIHITDSFNTQVYVVDYHVDIWNKGGWVDPFSDSNYTKRQRDYTIVLDRPQFYTPMAIINGYHIWPGTAKPEIGKSIQSIMSKPSKYFLRNQASVSEGGDTLWLAHTIWGNYDSCELQVALVQKEVKSKVTAGENAGKTLVHHDVVKVFKTFNVDQDKVLCCFPYPKGLDLTQYRVISFLQHKRTKHIYASDQVLFRR